LSLRDKYDIVIAGGGPAGSVAAQRAAALGMSVLLCEKRDRVGIPIRCAELSGYRSEISRFIDIDEKFIANDIKFCQVTSPNRKTYKKALPESPVMLNRSLFDPALFENAARAGAHTLTGAEVTGVDLLSNNNVAGVDVRINGSTIHVKCDFVLGADGVESKIGRMVGMNTVCPLKEIYSCVQYRVAQCPIDKDTISFYVGQKTVPNGYIWIFPKANGEANVGVAVIRTNGPNGMSPQDFLNNFIKNNFAKLEILEKTAGGIPLDGGLKTFAKGNTVLIGDAAHHANPFSGGGIMNSMEDADLFIKTLHKFINNKKSHKLNAYQKVYYRKYGKILKWQRIARNMFYSLEDKEIEKIFREVEKSLNGNFNAVVFERATVRAFIKVMPYFITKVGKILKA
jgi:digeranylgeranylglycerophospholipid reductase